MGRADSCGDPDSSPKFYMRKLKWVGDYDEGGAYWGWVRGTHIYRAEDGEDIVEHVRAASREDAKAKIVALYPKARFYR
jgi:hypothetical protein